MSQFQTIDLANYYDAETFARFKTFADDRETPFVVIDKGLIGKAYAPLQAGM